jgi:hypothetical protein
MQIMGQMRSCFFSAGFKKMREKENPKKIIATT